MVQTRKKKKTCAVLHGMSEMTIYYSMVHLMMDNGDGTQKKKKKERKMLVHQMKEYGATILL